MSYKITPVTENVQLGEGPHWDPGTQSLYYVDIFGKSIHKYTPSTNTHSKAVIDGDKMVSLIVPVENSSERFVIARGNELAVITWDGKSDRVSNFETITALENTETISHSWNDGKVDSMGRLWAGVIVIDVNIKDGTFPKTGKLYTLQQDKTLKQQVDQISLSNGLAWNEGLNKFYYIDSGERVVYQFDYDSKDCRIWNQEIAFSFKENNVTGEPDGMAIDVDGNLWVACFNGSKVIKIDPRQPGTLLETVEMPASQVTSVAFGGSNLDELFVTTGKIKAFDMKAAPEGPEHGVTYKITGLGVRGLAPYKVKL